MSLLFVRNLILIRIEGQLKVYNMKDTNRNKITAIIGISALVGGAALLVGYSKKISKKLYNFLHAKAAPLKSSARSLINKVKSSRKGKKTSHSNSTTRKRFSFRRQGSTSTRRKKATTHDTKHSK